MAIVTTKDMFSKALHEDYAVGAFNVNNMEIIQGIVEGAKAEDAPVILQVSAGARKYANPTYLVKLVEAAMEVSGLDLVLHLDHGADFDICKDCVDNGFSSVMIDGSKYTLEENIAVTKKVVDYAHDHGVVVEAELGKLAGIEDAVSVDARDATFTDPEEARIFVEETGVDSLAVAIGTSHGAYKFKGTPKLDFERLKKIHAIIPDTPLVLHGSSTVMPEFVALCNKYGGDIPGAQGVPEDMLTEAAKYGVCKINVDTDLRLAMTAKIRQCFAENPEEFDPLQYLGPGREAIKEMVEHKIRDVFRASNKR